MSHIGNPCLSIMTIGVSGQNDERYDGYVRTACQCLASGPTAISTSSHYSLGGFHWSTSWTLNLYAQVRWGSQQRLDRLLVS